MDHSRTFEERISLKDRKVSVFLKLASTGRRENGYDETHARCVLLYGGREKVRGSLDFNGELGLGLARW